MVKKSKNQIHGEKSLILISDKNKKTFLFSNYFSDDLKNIVNYFCLIQLP